MGVNIAECTDQELSWHISCLLILGKGDGNGDGCWGVNEYFQKKLETQKEFELVSKHGEATSMGTVPALSECCLRLQAWAQSLPSLSAA